VVRFVKRAMSALHKGRAARSGNPTRKTMGTALGAHGATGVLLSVLGAAERIKGTNDDKNSG
jgi:hypothetical protein